MKFTDNLVYPFEGCSEDMNDSNLEPFIVKISAENLITVK